jgi:hypothetical protein
MRPGMTLNVVAELVVIVVVHDGVLVLALFEFRLSFTSKLSLGSLIGNPVKDFSL